VGGKKDELVDRIMSEYAYIQKQVATGHMNKEEYEEKQRLIFGSGQGTRRKAESVPTEEKPAKSM
jgi:hypothetical protein